MADALAEHLASLPEAFLARIAKRVLHVIPGSRPLAERALAQHLRDPEWIANTVDRLGPRAAAALRALGEANAPVLRGDLHALAVGPDSDVLEELEEHGLIAPVRTGRGMPTHVALTPGIEGKIGTVFETSRRDGEARAPTGAALGGARVRFELALLLGVLAQHPPRLTKEGRVHAGDLASIADALEALGATTRTIERRLNRLTELGVLAPDAGQLVPGSAAFQDVPRLSLLLAVTELALPSMPRAVLAIVDRLLTTESTLPLRAVLDELQSSVLLERAEASEQARRGAKRELAEALGALLSLDAIVVLDEDGHPALLGGDALLARVASGAPLSLALEPVVASFLRAEELPPLPASMGHVQSSFEIVADPSCDATLVASIAAAAKLERADRAAVLKLERKSIEAARARGMRLDEITRNLAALSGRSVPVNVETLLRDWYGAGEPEERASQAVMVTPEEARIEAWRALDEARKGR